MADVSAPGLEDRDGDTRTRPVPAPAADRECLFRGAGEYSVDEKNRLTIPQHMRGPLADGGVLKVIESRAVIWTEQTFRDAVAMLNEQVGPGGLEQRQVRMFLAGVHPVSPDAQGRIVIPAKVREELGLGKDVFIAGCGPRIELWPNGRYEVEMLLEQDDSVTDALDAANY